MLFGKFSNYKNTERKRLVINSIIFLLLTVAIWRFICWNKFGIDSYAQFGDGFNPPSISLLIYSISFALMLFYMGKLIDNHQSKLIRLIWQGIGKIGGHSLYIFLYHRLLLDYLIPILRNISIFQIENIWVKSFSYFTIMIVGSIVIGILLRKGKNIYDKSY